MNKVWKILVVILLAICAVSLSYNSYMAYQAEKTTASQAETIKQIQQEIADITLKQMVDIQKNYKDSAYGGKVDRIAEQQLLATETTNEMLVQLSNQIALLAILVK